MIQDDTEKNGVVKNTIKIRIPALNEYPIKDIKHWAKQVYHQVRIKVHWRKAQKIKEMMPIETAAYAERKVFGNWRLVAPSRPDEKSPLQRVIEWLQDHIVPTRWGRFRRAFVKEIKIGFNAICDADYDPAMVDEVNQRLNQLLAKFTRTTPRRHTPRPPIDIGVHPSQEGNKSPLSRGDSRPNDRSVGRVGVCVHLNFVLRPETAEDYSSMKNLVIRSAIWERWTGQPLDFSQFIKPPGAQPLSLQMEMDLELLTPLEIGRPQHE